MPHGKREKGTLSCFVPPSPISCEVPIDGDNDDEMGELDLETLKFMKSLNGIALGLFQGLLARVVSLQELLKKQVDHLIEE